MSVGEVLIDVENVSKKFCRDLKKSLWYGAKDTFRDLFQVRKRSGEVELRDGEFWANNDVSFQVRRGECLAILGHNGAGKTTLLKVLSGLIKPDKGRVELSGNVGGLIALGAGFQPVLTGRENIFVNAAILGLSRRQTRDRLEEIIEFAGISQFVDTPVQNYSSGMKVRLGFAVAAVLFQPDVLLIDEVLAVGDTAFRSKCYREIGRLLVESAVIFVSHNLSAVGRICDSAILLERGQQICQGDVSSTVQRYLDASIPNSPTSDLRIISYEKCLKIKRIDAAPGSLSPGEHLCVVIDYCAERFLDDVVVRCNLVNDTDLLVADYSSDYHRKKICFQEGPGQLRIDLGKLLLSKGSYRMNLAAFKNGQKDLMFHAFDVPGPRVESKFVTNAVLELGHQLCCFNQEKS